MQQPNGREDWLRRAAEISAGIAGVLDALALRLGRTVTAAGLVPDAESSNVVMNGNDATGLLPVTRSAAVPD